MKLRGEGEGGGRYGSGIPGTAKPRRGQAMRVELDESSAALLAAMVGPRQDKTGQDGGQKVRWTQMRRTLHTHKTDKKRLQQRQAVIGSLRLDYCSLSRSRSRGRTMEWDERAGQLCVVF